MIDTKVKLKATIQPELTKDVGEGVVEAIVSTNSVDRHDEVIDVAGIDLKSYKNNPVVLYGHDYEALPIGKTISIKKEAGKLIAKLQFAIAEYPFAKTIYQLVKGGYLNDVSIGGIVKEYDPDTSVIKKLEMIEFSVVNIGANRDAKIIARSIDKTDNDIAKEYADFVNKAMTEKLQGIDSQELTGYINTLKNLTAMLEVNTEKAQNATAEVDSKVLRYTLKKTAQEVDKTAEKIILTLKKGNTNNE
jgi:HK97 family phage prohead protease